MNVSKVAAKTIQAMVFGLFLIAGIGAMANEGAAENTKGESKQEKVEASKEGLVNINTATEAELDTLPRIGPVIAKRIIAHRKEHGNFKSVEELMNVSGIGEKTFARLKDLITI